MLRRHYGIYNDGIGTIYIYLFSDFVVSRLPPSREIYFLPTSRHYKAIMSSQNRIQFIEKGQSKRSSKTQ